MSEGILAAFYLQLVILLLAYVVVLFCRSWARAKQDLLRSYSVDDSSPKVQDDEATLNSSQGVKAKDKLRSSAIKANKISSMHVSSDV